MNSLEPMLRRPLAQQIAEVRREIALRERAFPGLVLRKKMRQSEADEHLARMVAVLATLEWLQAHEDHVKAATMEWKAWRQR